MNLAERVLTVAEAAALMRVSRGSYYAAAARGELPAIRIGKRLVVPGAALQRLMEGVVDEMNGKGTVQAQDPKALD